MKKSYVILLLIITFVTGGASGGYLISKLQPTPKTATTSTSNGQQAQPAPARTIDKTSGFNMTPPDMAEEMQAMPADEDIGWRYANYIIMIRNNEIAMARAAKDKATQPEIKKIAQEQIDANEDIVSQLYGLMRAAGMSH